MKLLLIDDSLVIRSFLKDTFIKEGYDVVEANCGKTAIKIYQEEWPDFVLSDYEMPELTGLETLQEIKKIQPDVSAIIFTARLPSDDGSDTLRRETEELGIKLLYKNVGMPNLVKSVKESLAAMRLRPRPISVPVRGGSPLRGGSPQSPLAGLMLLMADNNVSTVANAKGFLADKGIVVLNAANSAELLTKIKSGTVPLVILDNTFNSQNGFAVLKELRTADKNVKVIMTITNQEEPLAKAAMNMAQLLLTNFILKPYDLNNLHKMIAEVCNNGHR